jgi:ADP-heptose:LPS heptosyltransferase
MSCKVGKKFSLSVFNNAMKKHIKKNIKNILVVRRNNIGDMVCAIPMLRTLRNEFPEAHITVLADSFNAGIIEGASFIDEVIAYKPGSGIFRNKYLGYLKLLCRVKRNFDLVIAVKPGFSSLMALIALASGAKLRMGCIPRKWHPLQLLYNLPVKDCKRWKTINIVEGLLEFIKVLGIEETVNDISIDITPSSAGGVKLFFEKSGMPPGINKVVFNISNNKPENTWHEKKYLELAELISEHHETIIIITSAPSDREKAMQLVKEIKGKALYYETPSVMDFAALVSVASLLVCGEGGAMHVGAGVHTPTISLWGKNRPVKWRPYGEKQFVLTKGENVNSIAVRAVMDLINENNLLI